MRRAGTAGDREAGAAALEFSLFFVLLLVLLSLIAPLGVALAAKASAGRAAGDAARFATQVPDRARPHVSAGQRKPTVQQVCANAYLELLPAGTPPPECGTTVGVGNGASSVTVDCPAGCDPGRLPGVIVTVTVTRVVDLSVFGAILGGAGLGDGSITVVGTSTGRQE